jgi:hypothetical protein
MLYKEERLHYYTFDLNQEAVQGVEFKDHPEHILRWSVKFMLFNYLNKRFIDNNNGKYYDFEHKNNIRLITNDEDKINDISAFIHMILIDNKLVHIFTNNPLDKFGNKDQELFDKELDKLYDYFILNKELSNSNNYSKKVKL